MTELSGEALDALARDISERLQALVLGGGASPTISAANVFLLRELVKQPGDFEGELISVCQLVLSDVQDQVIRDLKEGWPPSADGAPGDRDPAPDLPEAEAAVVSGTLRLWYGDAWRPALELPPIRLEALGLDVQ